MIHQRRITESILFLVASLLAAIFLLPMIYTFISSLKPASDIFKIPIQWIPRRIRLENFVEPFVRKNFEIYFINSTFIAATVTCSSLFFSSLAGYSLAKFNYKGRRLLLIIVLLTMMVPIEVTMVPLAIIVHHLGWMNTYRGLIIPVMISPFAIFWMRQFMITLPNDYIESARIEGVGEFSIFRKVVIPLCQPALGALAIFTFMGNWNSLIWPLIVAGKDRLRTIPVGLLAFESEFHTPFNELFAMAIVAVIPTLIFFLILRRKLIKGLAMVGIKN